MKSAIRFFKSLLLIELLHGMAVNWRYMLSPK